MFHRYEKCMSVVGQYIYIWIKFQIPGTFSDGKNLLASPCTIIYYIRICRVKVQRDKIRWAASSVETAKNREYSSQWMSFYAHAIKG